MTWTHDAGDRAYTLIRDDVRARIWRGLGSWEAIVSGHGGALSAGDFKTAEEAKAWCEARITERQTKGHG